MNNDTTIGPAPVPTSTPTDAPQNGPAPVEATISAPNQEPLLTGDALATLAASRRQAPAQPHIEPTHAAEVTHHTGASLTPAVALTKLRSNPDLLAKARRAGVNALNVQQQGQEYVVFGYLMTDPVETGVNLQGIWFTFTNGQPALMATAPTAAPGSRLRGVYPW